MLGGRCSLDRSALRAVVFVDREPAACMSHCYHHAKAQAAATYVKLTTAHAIAATCTQELQAAHI
jgi:hypothetical protein